MEMTKKLQIAAMNADGSSIDEIAAVTGIDEETVAAFVAERNEKNGKKTVETPAETPKKGRGHRLSEQTKQAIREWYQSGHSISATAKKFGVDPKSVRSAIELNTPKETEASSKSRENVLPLTSEPLTSKNEPAPAPTETSPVSSDDDTNSSHPNNNRILEICQENLDRAAKDMLSMYERMSPEEQRAWDLGEIFGSISRGLGEFV